MALNLFFQAIITGAFQKTLEVNCKLMLPEFFLERDAIMAQCDQRDEAGLVACRVLREKIAPMFDELDATCHPEKEDLKRHTIERSYVRDCLKLPDFHRIRRTERECHEEAKRAFQCYISKLPHKVKTRLSKSRRGDL